MLTINLKTRKLLIPLRKKQEHVLKTFKCLPKLGIWCEQTEILSNSNFRVTSISSLWTILNLNKEILILHISGSRTCNSEVINRFWKQKDAEWLARKTL